MKRNPKENSDSTIDRLYFLIIAFLIGALIYLLFMIVSSGRNLSDHWDKGPGIHFGFDSGSRVDDNRSDRVVKGDKT